MLSVKYENMHFALLPYTSSAFCTYKKHIGFFACIFYLPWKCIHVHAHSSAINPSTHSQPRTSSTSWIFLWVTKYTKEIRYIRVFLYWQCLGKVMFKHLHTLWATLTVIRSWCKQFKYMLLWKWLGEKLQYTDSVFIKLSWQTSQNLSDNTVASIRYWVQCKIKTIRSLLTLKKERQKLKYFLDADPLAYYTCCWFESVRFAI